MKRWWGAAVGAVVSTISVVGQADVSGQCAADAQRGDAEVHRDARAARYAYRACSAAECPYAVRTRCAEEEQALRAAMPAIIVTMHDGAGNATPATNVVVDGEVVTTENGAIALEAGAHDVRVVGVDGVEQHVLVREHDRRDIVFLKPGATDVSVTLRRTTWPWVVTTSGAVSVLGGVAMTIGGWAMYNGAQNTCSGGEAFVAEACRVQQNASAQTGAIVNHVGLGFILGGAVVAGVGMLWYFIDRRTHAKPVVGRTAFNFAF